MNDNFFKIFKQQLKKEQKIKVDLDNYHKAIKKHEHPDLDWENETYFSTLGYIEPKEKIKARLQRKKEEKNKQGGKK